MIIANQLWLFWKQLVIVLVLFWTTYPLWVNFWSCPLRWPSVWPPIEIREMTSQLQVELQKNYQEHQKILTAVTWRHGITAINSNIGRKHCQGTNTVLLDYNIFMGNTCTLLLKHQMVMRIDFEAKRFVRTRLRTPWANFWFKSNCYTCPMFAYIAR